MFFYYEKKFGKPMPRTSEMNPADSSTKPILVGEVIRLSPQEVLESLAALAAKYPPKGTEK